MDMESVLLRLNQRLKLMLSMDMVLDTTCILWDMVMDILVMVMDMVLAMALMDMESVLLRLKLMLSMDMVLDITFILWDMVMDILVMAMDMVLAMALMDMESVMLLLNQSPMLSMDLMAGTAMDLDTVLTPWDMDMDMAMGMDMDIMVELSDTTNQAWHYNDQVPPSMHDGPNIFLVCFKYSLNARLKKKKKK